MKPFRAALRIFPLLMSVPLFFSCAAYNAPPAGRGNAVTSDEHLRLGAIYESQSLPDLALREYQRAAEVGPEKAAAHFAAGNLHLRLKRYREAEKAYSLATRLSPEDPLLHNNLAWALMGLGDTGRAVDSARAALRLDPKRGYIYLDTLGVAEMRMGDFPAAERHLTEAAASAPPAEVHGLREIYSHLMELYARTGEMEKAARAEEMLGRLGR